MRIRTYNNLANEAVAWNNVLSLSVPKAEAVKPKQIKIQTK